MVLLVLYLIGVVAVFTTIFISGFLKDDVMNDDPWAMGFGLFISFLVGTIWPVFIAVFPLLGLVWVAGKGILLLKNKGIS